jgi:hypothetical protein
MFITTNGIGLCSLLTLVWARSGAARTGRLFYRRSEFGEVHRFSYVGVGAVAVAGENVFFQLGAGKKSVPSLRRRKVS